MTERMVKLKELLSKDPHDAFVKHALALEYSKLGDETSARRLYEEILEHDPSYTGSYYQLGKLLERTGETALAIQWYEKGMTVARAAGEGRAYNELRAAYDDLADS
jgi:Tfp pilus assembly protein PilF